MGCSATPVRDAQYGVRRDTQYLDEVTTEFAGEHRGGDFSPIEPTSRGGPDYGRFVEAVRTVQDRARAADAPDAVITEAADLLESVSNLLAPYEADEWSSPAGRRMDLPNRGSVLGIPAEYHKTEDDRIGGIVHFRRFHLGRNGAVHGGCIAQLFDSLLGYTAFRLTRSLYQRTAFLHVDYRKIVPIETKLQVDAGVDHVDGRKMFIAGRLLDGDDVLAEANALFVKLKPGQP
jgi:acyl-coenzyme A thioesterase PaaI-like protein